MRRWAGEITEEERGELFREGINIQLACRSSGWSNFDLWLSGVLSDFEQQVSQRYGSQPCRASVSPVL